MQFVILEHLNDQEKRSMSQQLQVLKRLCFSAMALSVAGFTVISTQAAWAQDVPPATPSTDLNNGSGAGSNLNTTPGSTVQPTTNQTTPAQPLRTQQRPNVDTIRIDGGTTPTSPASQNGIGQQNDTLNQDSTIDQNGTMQQDGMMQQDGTFQQDTNIQQNGTTQPNGTTNTSPTSQPGVTDDVAPTSQPTNTEDTDADAITGADQSPAAWW